MHYRTFILASVGMACFAPLAQAQLPEKITTAFDSYIAAAEEIAPILEKVQDKASADSASAPMKKAMLSLYHAHNNMQAIEQLSPAQNEQIRKQYEQPMREKWGKVYEQIFRISKAKCYQSPSFSKHFHVMCMMMNQ